MDKMVRETSRGLQASSDLFLKVEHAIYIALGLVPACRSSRSPT